MDKSNLIVNYLPSSFTEDDLREMFQKFGTVQSIKIVRDKVTGISMGFGFVNFESNEAAVSAMNAMNGTHLPQGKVMKVSVARPAWKANIHSNLYVAGIPVTFTEDDIKTLFSDGLGETDVENVRLLRDSQGAFRGIAVVRFDREEAACEVMRKFNGAIVAEGYPPLQIKPWRPEFRPDRVDGTSGLDTSSTISPRVHGLLSHDIMSGAMNRLYTPSPVTTPIGGLNSVMNRRTSSNGLRSPAPSLRSDTPPPMYGTSNDYMPNFQEIIEMSLKQQQQAPGATDPVAFMTAAYANAIAAAAAAQQQTRMTVPPPAGLANPTAQNPIISAAAAMAAAAAAMTTPPPSAMTTPMVSPSGEGVSASLFVFHLPVEATESTLRVLFEPYGQIENVKVVPGKGYGFVNFENAANAAVAVESLNGFKLGTKHLKVEFKKPGGMASGRPTPTGASPLVSPVSYGM